MKNITDTKESAVVDTIAIHPNPVQLSNSLWLEYNLQKPGLYQISMTDIEGRRQRVKSLRLNHSGRLYLGDWVSQTGIYVFDIVHENKTIKSIKVIAY